MKKVLLYIDTSVICFLDDNEPSENKENAQLLWVKLKNDEYDVIISDLTLQEIENNLNIERVKVQLALLTEIQYKKVFVNNEVRNISETLKSNGILISNKQENDRLHIGCAVYYGADYLVSNNFKHLVHATTMKGVRVLSVSEGYKNVDIIAPISLV
jgi:predicted nucleic acid-binding protein